MGVPEPPATEPPANASTRPADAFADLAEDRRLLGRTSMVDQVTGVLRTRITEGYFPPEQRLSEKLIGESLGVSRNTLREAFRLLSQDGLVEHRLNRGVFVRLLDAPDVVAVYRSRKIIECGAIRSITAPPAGLANVERAVAEGRAASAQRDWRALGSANIHFHRALVALAGAPDLDELMERIFARLRLVFHVMTNPSSFHEPYLERNEGILGLLRAGDGAEADRVLADYLDDAERQLVAAYNKSTVD